MPTITDAEHEEFESLRRHYRQESIQQSAAALTLEQDIDQPIKKCVMALALLGCEPVWSCCGFDYAGQPVHKKHQNEIVGIVLRDNERTRWLDGKLKTAFSSYEELPMRWHMGPRYICGDSDYVLTSDLKRGNTWPDPDCIHFSEPAAIAIQMLESVLISLSAEFLESMTLTDTNIEFHNRYEWWQYPTKAPWVIRKADLVLERGLA